MKENTALLAFAHDFGDVESLVTSDSLQVPNAPTLHLSSTDPLF